MLGSLTDHDDGHARDKEGNRVGSHTAREELSDREANDCVDRHEDHARRGSRFLRDTEQQRQDREGTDVNAAEEKKNTNSK